MVFAINVKQLKIKKLKKVGDSSLGGGQMKRRKGLNYVKFQMEISSQIKDKDWTGEHDKWLKFDVCMLDADKFEPHFDITLSGQKFDNYEKVIAEEISIKQLIDLQSFIGCVLKMRKNK